MFIILKQWIDTIKVETDVNIDNEEDVIGLETDAFCVPQECEPEMSHILRWFFDLQSCLYGALHLLTMLRADTVS